MKSPFPGMDPYLEARWSNVHVLMMGAITAALNGVLPDGLEARPEEEIRVETVGGERLHGYRGDIAVVDTGPRETLPTRSASVTALAEPIHIAYRRGPLVLRNVQIIDTRDGGRIVTVIEVLSPWNKLAGQLNRDYLRKLGDFEAGDTNWVEIDLLRSSRDRLAITWQDLPADKRADYLVATYRAADGQVLAYPISLRQPLPVVKLPLRETDPDVLLDLQAVLDRVYAEGPFRSIIYSRPAEPPLAESDAAWAQSLLTAAETGRSG